MANEKTGVLEQWSAGVMEKIVADGSGSWQLGGSITNHHSPITSKWQMANERIGVLE